MIDSRLRNGHRGDERLLGRVSTSAHLREIFFADECHRSGSHMIRHFAQH